MKKIKIILLILLLLGGAALAANNYLVKQPQDNKNVTLGVVSKSKPTVKKDKENEEKLISKQKSYKVYFPSETRLRAENRSGDFAAENAINELLKGPKDKGNISYIPKNTKLISVKISNDTAMLNFSKEILKEENAGAQAETLTLYSITNTMTQNKQIKNVIIQIEGKVEGEVDQYLIEDFWGHVGLYDQPFKENKSLIKED